MDVTNERLSSSVPLVAERAEPAASSDFSDRVKKFGAASHVQNGQIITNCVKIKQEVDEGMSRNGISCSLSPENFGKSSVCRETAHVKQLQRCPQLADPKFSNSQHAQSDSSDVQVSPLDLLEDSGEHLPEHLKQNCVENVRNGDCNLEDSEYFVSKASLKSDPALLNCFSVDNLFDPSIVLPNSSFELESTGNRSLDNIQSTSFKTSSLKSHDVCQNLLNEVLEMEKNDETVRMLHLSASDKETMKIKATLPVEAQLSLNCTDSTESELQSKSQGLTDDHRALALIKMQTLNGFSTCRPIYSLKSDVSRSSENVDSNSVLSVLDCMEVAVCDTAIRINKDVATDANASAANSFPVNPISCSLSPVAGDGLSYSVFGVVTSTKNFQTPDIFRGAVSQNRKLLPSVNWPLEVTGKPNLGRAPKARKSCGPYAKDPRKSPVSTTTDEISDLNQDFVVDAKTAEVAVPSASLCGTRPTLSSMTIKLPELENVLGIGYKSLDKMDAKTLDRIVLAKAQKKFKADGEFEKLSLMGSIECSDKISRGNSIPDKAVSNCLSRLIDREVAKAVDRKGFSINDEISDQVSTRTASSQLTYMSNDYRAADGRDSVQNERTLSVKAVRKDESPTKTSFPESGHIFKGLKENSDLSGIYPNLISRSKDPKISNRTGLSPLSLANSTIFKARKSQGYAFGRVKRCRDILIASSNVSETFQLVSAPVSPETSKSTSLPTSASSPVKEEDMFQHNFRHRAKKQATTASHLPLGRRTSDSFTESEQNAGGSVGRRQNRKRKSDGHFSSMSSPNDISAAPTKKLTSATVESFPVPHRRPIKSAMLRAVAGVAHEFEKLEQLERTSVSSSSSADNFSVKLPRRLAKISLPVTPPRSPEGCAAQSSDEFSLPSVCRTNSGTQRPSFSKCCCEQPVILNVGNFTMCHGIESVDGKVIGCTRRWTNGKIVRPSTKIPFMALCDKHSELLSDHRCCPGCGQFCIQGEFYQCRKSSSGKLHTFHRHCQAFRNGRYLCPHCGVESCQESTVLQTANQCSASNAPEGRGHRRFGNARLGCFSLRRGGQASEGSICSMSNSFSSGTSQADDSFLLGFEWKELETSLAAISAAGKEKLKKIRPCAKSFFAACKNGDLERVVYMISEGVDPNLQPDDYGESCLHVAVRNGHREIVKLLLQAGALPNSLDLRLQTPLMAAAIKGHRVLLEVLIQAGGSLHCRANDGMTILHLAAKAGQLAVIRLLVENYKMDVNVKDDGGWTPVIWATEYTHVACVKYFLSTGANPNIQDNELNTGLHWAAFAGSTEISKMFLDSGCDLECSNERGDRPLHIASRQNHYECVSMFLMRGADVTAVNRDNLTPLECCPFKDSSTRLNLTIKKMLLQSADLRTVQPEKLVHEDVSLGRESIPITVVNGIDKTGVPSDFTYVADYVETIPVNINRVITSLRMCDCREDCSNINCNCMRSCIKCWYEKTGRLIEEFCYQDPPLIYECNRACRCYTNCQNRVIQNGITCRLQVFRTKCRGWGCRTLLDITKGSFVCEYFGELISDAEADRRQDDSYLFDLDNQETDTFCVDAARYGNVSRFINHLCEPNLTPIKVFVDHQDLRFPRMCFFANRDIRANEELGFDYGDKFWVIKYKDFTCDCGSTKCRYSVSTIGKTLEDFRRRQEEETGHATMR